MPLYSFITILPLMFTVLCKTQGIKPTNIAPLWRLSKYLHDRFILHEFLEQYAPPEDVIQSIDSHFELFISFTKPHIFLCNGKLYYLKGQQISRLLNAIKLKDFITKNGLTSIDVAKKYIYPKNNTYLIVAQYIEEEDNIDKKYITPTMMKELILLTENTRFADWKCFSNLIFAKNGKLTIVDTEDRSFINNYRHAIHFTKKHLISIIHLLNEFEGFIHMLENKQNSRYNKSIRLNKSTYAWLKKYVEDSYLQSKITYGTHVNLKKNSTLDSLDITLNRIKKQLIIYKALINKNSLICV